MYHLFERLDAIESKLDAMTESTYRAARADVKINIADENTTNMMALYKRLPRDLQKKVEEDIKKLLSDEIVEGRFRFGGKLLRRNQRASCTVMSFAINQDLPRTDDYVIGYVDLTREDANEEWELELKNATPLMYDHVKSSTEDSDCAICLESIRRESEKHCQRGHSFHAKCLNRWSRVNESCPLCRDSTDVEEIVYNLYDEGDNVDLRKAIVDGIDNDTPFTKHIGPSLILHFVCTPHQTADPHTAELDREGKFKCVKIYLTRIQVIGKITLDIDTQPKQGSKKRRTS